MDPGGSRLRQAELEDAPEPRAIPLNRDQFILERLELVEVSVGDWAGWKAPP